MLKSLIKMTFGVYYVIRGYNKTYEYMSFYEYAKTVSIIPVTKKHKVQ
jgi:hypothetical protein